MRGLVELTRVVRRGGNVVLIDTDWRTQVLEGPDPGLTRRVLGAWSRYLPNSSAGRQLFEQARAAGLEALSVECDEVVRRDARFPFYAPFNAMARVATAIGDLTLPEATDWTLQLRASAGIGEAYWKVTLFVVKGSVP